MRGRTADEHIPTSPARGLAHRVGGVATRKIWLPKSVYDALPFFYFGAGVVAFLATLYISAWVWVLPHYLLFSVACVHFGVVIFRRRDRSAGDEPDDSLTG